jgi:(4S)-4-hydroxy-5-phosphonooxypentane-2,3-dione isomerase
MHMHIVHVFIRVKPEFTEAFKAACADNAENSIQEPGIVRFDVIQQADDPARFVLVEVYRTREDQPRHRKTGHYARWRETVENMMAEPRQAVIYTNVYPEDSGWEKAHAV